MINLARASEFKFHLFGSTPQLRIQTPEDLCSILDLDEAHWLATTAPVATLNADAEFLKYLDSDADGRIHAAELKAAVSWTFDHLSDTSGIQQRSLCLVLSAIDPSGASARPIREAAERILRRQGNAQAGRIDLETVRGIKLEQQRGGLDRPGLVLPNATEDPQLREFLEDILRTIGGEPHPSGCPAVSEKQIAEFVAEARCYLDWLAQSDVPPGGGGSARGPLPPTAEWISRPGRDLRETFRLIASTATAIMPFGEQTEAAFALYAQLRAKLDEFFLLAKLADVDPAMAARLRRQETESAKLDLNDSEAIRRFVAAAPLAWPGPDGTIELNGRINPEYEAQLRAFHENVLARIWQPPPARLTDTDWEQIKELFAPHERWRAARPDVTVGDLPAQKLRTYLADAKLQSAAQELIDRSYAVALDLENVRLVEKLILFQGYLLLFVNSFVSFPDLFDPARRALFEMGTLIMDGRHFRLSVKVLDRARHAKFSDASNMFMLYVEISAHEGQRLYEVAVPVTSGNRGNLQVGKWGVFIDRDLQERHAQIVHIVENPISLSEALVAPFKRLGKTFSAKLSERALKAETQLQTIAGQPISPAPISPPPLPPGATAAPGARDPRWTGGLLAGGGIALAAMGSSFAFLTSAFSKLTWPSRIGYVAGGILAVLAPVTAVALVKLSQRDLSALLEGSGWGVNPRIRLTRAQARVFNSRPDLPAEVQGQKSRSGLWLVLLILLALLGILLCRWATDSWPFRLQPHA